VGLNFSQSLLKAFRLEYSIYFGGFIVARSDEIMYSMITMKFLRKIITGSLIVTLTSFAGSFCARPMQAQAAMIGGGDSMVMDMSLSDMEHGTEDGDTAQVEATATSTINLCVLNCATNALQATAIKKASIDNTLNVLAVISQTEQLQSFEFFPNPSYMTGVHPPSPDILSSVVKIE